VSGKRPSLVSSMKAAAAVATAPVAPPPPAPVAAPPAVETKGRNRSLTDASATTAVHLPREDIALLRRVAVERANRSGGRPSVSDVLRDLIERNRAELEREAAR
jgi:hypothetical protein